MTAVNKTLLIIDWRLELKGDFIECTVTGNRYKHYVRDLATCDNRKRGYTNQITEVLSRVKTNKLLSHTAHYRNRINSLSPNNHDRMKLG